MNVEVPADLTTLSDEELTALSAALVAEFDRLYDEGGASLEVLAELSAAIQATRLDGERREAESAAAAADAAALYALVHPTAEGDPVEPDDGEGTDPDEGGESTDEGTPAEPELVTAAAAPAPSPMVPARPTAAAVARHAPRPQVPVRNAAPEIVITAAADVPGYATGGRMGLIDIAKGMHERAFMLNDHSGRKQVARIRKPMDPETQLNGDAEHDEAVFDGLLAGRTAQSLVASGGWCTPSQPLYDLFQIGDTQELLDLPTVGAVRGGLLVPSFYVYGDGAAALWNWTEAMDGGVNATITNKALTSNVATLTTSVAHSFVVGQTVNVSIGDIAFDGTWTVASVPSNVTFTYADTHANVSTAAVSGTATAQGQKGCLKIPCPTWTDYRLEAEGLCVTHGNLTERSFPELSKAYINVVMMGHQHKMSAAALAKMTSGATGVTLDSVATDAAGSILSGIDLVAADYRSKYRVSRTAIVEMALPTWTINAIRADLAMRTSVENYLNMPDAAVIELFTARNIRPQFLSDYQPLSSGASKTSWPTSWKALMWFAGAYVKADGGQIDLGVQRDSVLNATNDFTAAWSEEFYQVVRKGPLARELTITIAVNGVTGCCPTS